MIAPIPVPVTPISEPLPGQPNLSRRGVTLSTVLLALTMILLVPRMAAAEGVRESHPNLVGGELLGRGFVTTVNYERFLNNRFGLGAGIMAIGSGDGIVGIMPLYASFLPGDVHSLYLSAGGAFFGGGGTFHTYESTWIMQGSIGYQYQSPSGFFIRPLFTINKLTPGSSGIAYVWPGITIGGSF